MKIGMKGNKECPICGQTVTTVKSWVKCPRERKSVCMKHCFSGCKYMNEGMSLPRCSYIREKEKTTLSYIGP